MKVLAALSLLVFAAFSAISQSPAQKIYDTEKAFEKMVAEKGMRDAFIEYMAPDGVMLFPEAANARERWRSNPASPAALTWNPILIDVSSNGVLAYSIGNSVYKAKGKDDTNAYAGHYLSVWTRQPNGEYRAVFDTGINHEAPANVPTIWKSPAGMGTEKNEKKLSAADSSTGFFMMAESSGAAKAYKAYLADDAIVMREGSMPFVGKKAAADAVGKTKGEIKFVKRKSFIEAADLAYHHSLYDIKDKSGNIIERGNYAQVWKLRNGKWQIVADIFVEIPKK